MFSKETLPKDLFASFVVFLISLPLCLGIAIASGIDPLKGLFTGIVGGVVVAVLSGAPLQISGPSAGLAVMVLHVVDVYGPQSLIPLGIIIGLFQISTAVFKVAHFFQATPPALLKAMLSGIGALILMAQSYVLFDLKMSSKGLENLMGLPGIFIDLFAGNFTESQIHSGIVGVAVVAILAAWKYGKGQFFELFPGPLASTLFAAALVYFMGWDVRMIQLPDDIFAAALDIEYGGAFSNLSFDFLLYALGFAFVASAETLLCVSAPSIKWPRRHPITTGKFSPRA